MSGTVSISVAAIPASRSRSLSLDKSRTSNWRLQLEGFTFPAETCTHAPPTLNSTFPGNGSKSGTFPKSREYHSRDFGRSLTVITVMASLASIAPCAKFLALAVPQADLMNSTKDASGLDVLVDPE